ncbi:CDP-6-deoxy-delta-3,4-glucoseen reductase [Photobacterium alginatilyticum]|uniref:CDP-6-deoxy-delta-3,4-glucoseen reductase n=1 Tax=Photobacterium alginatilyticum TaxID=1775171 RepID=A0ABW9YEC5_9GAMM|nr:CDP-6-deoxy-delta-3,4-glucoseen reductase [Photobacterium alginatilyticum]NBI51621.1 CDP-6-deoxy-delta-3,4-glucoseen reductase [Photobacterium alginatilyticum]
MTFNIEIHPSGKCFKSDMNLLEDAISQSIPLEHSCKTGECGACSVELLSGTVENENGVVVDTGTILTCQSKALSDAVLKANYYPELAHIKQQTLPCKVAAFEYVTQDIVVIRFRFPPTAKFDYLPGQYVDLNFKGVKRSYSIANAKRECKELELHIRKVPNGQMSELIFGELKDNQLMRIEGPKGTFFVRDSTRPLILLAGGTGVAPVKAIVEELIKNEDPREVYIYWGMPSSEGFYLESLETIAKEKSNFHYIPVLSGNGDWSGRKGLVHQAVCEDFESLEKYDVYACGSPIMIDTAKHTFFEKGLLQDSFYSDAFTPSK